MRHGGYHSWAFVLEPVKESVEVDGSVSGADVGWRNPPPSRGRQQHRLAWLWRNDLQLPVNQAREYESPERRKPSDAHSRQQSWTHDVCDLATEEVCRADDDDREGNHSLSFCLLYSSLLVECSKEATRGLSCAFRSSPLGTIF